MKYMGSKAKYAKEILPIILKNRVDGQAYVEPFVGAGNVIHLVSGERYGNDKNKNMIELLERIRDGWNPPENVSEEKYNDVKLHPEKYSGNWIAFVAIGCSYGGKWFGGYARGNDSKGNPRNYCKESRENILKQKPGLQGIWFSSDDYSQMNIPNNSIIYCDPPYKGTTKYKDKFDHDEFWDWCEDKVFDGHTVFVSEYNAPEGWECVWEKKVNNSLTKNTGGKQGIERLFTKTK